MQILATVFDVSLDSTELELYISALHDVLQGESDDWTARYFYLFPHYSLLLSVCMQYKVLYTG